MKDRTLRSIGTAMLCSYLLKDVCENVKEESEIYHKRTKNLTNNLLETISGAISKAESLQNIRKASEYVGRELETEVIGDEIQTNAEIIKIIAELLMTMKPVQIYDLHLLLTNFKDGKKVYTKQELEYEKVK